jgi:hypothetical protein
LHHPCNLTTEGKTTMPLSSGLCSLDGWTLDESCMKIPPDTPPETIERWRLVAAELLYALTGNRFGPSCPVTVRPCLKRCFDGFRSFLFQGQPVQSTGGWAPYMRGGQMYNASLCGCTSDCHCGPELCQVYLPGPVYDIVSVDVDGEVVDPATYGILDGQYLVRSSATPEDAAGGTCWPGCQDMSLIPGQPNTFTVVYRTGLPLSALGVAALSELAAHYIRGCDGCGCGVGSNKNLSRLSRQGVDLQFIDPQQVLEDGRTGIPITDQFIHAVNPGKLPRAMRVLSPDSPKAPRIWYSGAGV